MPSVKTKNGKKLIAFGWYGGKYSHLNWLLPLLPESHHYCDPFAGSAAVLLNREPSPVETYNDIDSDVANFFRVLRDHKDELIYKIGMTPFSREEFKKSIEIMGDNSIDKIERARLFFVRARQVRTGLAQTATNGRWANCLKTSRASMAGAVSRWLGSIKGLEYIASRLLRVQIESDDTLYVIDRYDSDKTLFYCDPPYPHESRGDTNSYEFEMSDKDHEELANSLHSVDGKVAISGYYCDLMEDLYGDWNVHFAETKKAQSIKKDRTEVLWKNYNI